MMGRKEWMGRWMSGRTRRDIPMRWMAHHDRIHADWEDAPVDGWPPPDPRAGSQRLLRHWDVAGILAGKVYTDSEERWLHAWQDLWRRRHKGHTP